MKYILLFLICNITLYAQNGDLDNSFGTNGKVITDVGGSDIGYSTAIQSDGKIVVSGITGNSSDYDFALMRYNSNGSLDSTFGASGKVITPIGNTWSFARDVAIQSDGKIVVAGYFLANAFTDFAVVRYNSDGSLDNTFGVNGIVTLSLSNADDRAFSVAIQSDGKIIVAGQSDGGDDNKFSLIRLNSNGGLDNTFGILGVFVSDVGFGHEFVSSIIILNNGKILMTGITWNGFTLIRIEDNGSIDSTFGSSGVVYTTFANYSAFSNTISTQDDGKIIVIGAVYDGMSHDIAIARYYPNGSIDSTFGLYGKVITEFDSLSSIANSIMIQTDGKIVIGGIVTYIDRYDFGLLRYNINGSLDNSFGLNGLVRTNFNDQEISNSGALQTDGKIILVGSGHNGSNNDIVLARFNSSTTGINDKIESSDITIYPNPTSGILTLKTNHNCEVRIFDVLGKCIVTKHISSNINATLDLSSQRKGMYFIEMVTENNKTVKKIVLE